MALFNFLSNKGSSVLGIDIGSSAIKVVELKSSKGVVTLKTYGSIALGPYSNSDVGKSVVSDKNILTTALKDVLREANVGSNVCGVSTPFQSSFISLIETANIPEEKIAQIIPYEARKYIPVPIEEVSIDWFIIPQDLFDTDEDEEVKRRVLLIAIHNRELIRYREIFNETKLKIKFLEVEIFSTLRTLSEDHRHPLMIIDIGNQTSKFYIVEKGIVLRSYFINQGGEVMTKTISKTLSISFAEAELQKRKYGLKHENETVRSALEIPIREIASETNRATADFEQRYGKSVSKVILTGGGAATKGLINSLSRQVKAPIAIANPFESMEYPASLHNTLELVGPEFSVSIGAALRLLRSK